MAGALVARLGHLRLASGLVLFFFVFTHYLNHALGLISLEAMETGRVAFSAAWRSRPGTAALYGAFTVHTALSLWSLFRRRTLRRLGAADIVQAIFGLAILPLIIFHIIATRGIHEMQEVNGNYAYVLLSLWLWDPLAGIQQTVALLVVWVHGCIGLHYWLRLKPGYAAVRTPLYTVAVLLPVLALLGFSTAARETVRLTADPDWLARFRAEVVIGPMVEDWAYQARDYFRWLMVGLAATLLVGRIILALIERRPGLITLSYPMRRMVAIRPGSMTILEASRLGGIPHASVCGGRGRCSTCRVRVGPGGDLLPPPSEEEAKVLKRVGAPPGVRLACQTRPVADLTVTPLLPPGAQPKDAHAQSGFAQGAEREIAILFADLRAFTKFSETKLPYDVVFIINQFSQEMGRAVESAGGQIDKFIGDGVMALFGIEAGPADGCRRALVAARTISENLAEMNRTLAHDLKEPFRIGIGIHVGAAIVGEMGYGSAITVTAIGDAVNTASRLEQATKDYGAQLVFSREVATRAGFDVASLRHERIEVRGRDEPLEIIVVPDAGTLAV